MFKFERAWLQHPAVLWFCRLSIGSVYLVAAIGKLRDPVKFMGSMSEYHILPAPLLPIGAAGMPGVELVIAVSLLLGFRLRPAGGIAAGLMVVFMIAIASAMARGLELDCSCFDLLGISSKVGWGVLGRDALLLLPCLPLIFRRKVDGVLG